MIMLIEETNIIQGVPLNLFTPDSAKSKIEKFPKIINWVKSKTKKCHSKEQFNSFPMNGHTLEFCPWNRKLKNFVSYNVALWESKG